MNFDGAAIAAATGGTLVKDGPPGPIATDTRSLPAGAWFVALVGPRFDGHDFLDRAEAAAGCVVDREVPGWPAGRVRVADTTAALQDLGRAARRRLRGPVIGIGGSSGKTTTRALTALALSPLGPVHQTAHNLNNHIGVPLTLVGAPEDVAAAVVELGTSAPGEIARLADICDPDIRVLVNIGAEHLEELGDLDGVAREEGDLFATATPGQTLCVNMDDPFIARMPIPSGVRALMWGRDPLCDVRLLDATVDPDTLTTHARYAVRGTRVDATIPAPGVHFALNGAAALAVALACDVDPRAAAAALAGYAPVGMRLRVETLPGGVVALNDAYNANPDSMAASLRTLAALPGRRVAVLGDMLELGPDEARFHDEVAALALDLGLDRVVLVGPRMSGAAAGRVDPRLLRSPDAEGVAAELARWLEPGDRVLFKGSRGARVERILQSLRAVLAARSEEP